MSKYLVSSVEYTIGKHFRWASVPYVVDRCTKLTGSKIVKRIKDPTNCIQYNNAKLQPDMEMYLLEVSTPAPAPEYTEVKDSGARESFATGSVRDTQEGKGRFDLIDPYAMLRLAKHYENGAKKYGDRNWEKGQPSSRYLSSAFRHLFKYLAGMRDEDHLAAAAWNVFAILHNEEVHKEMHDLEAK